MAVILQVGHIHALCLTAFVFAGMALGAVLWGLMRLGPLSFALGMCDVCR